MKKMFVYVNGVGIETEEEYYRNMLRNAITEMENCIEEDEIQSAEEALKFAEEWLYDECYSCDEFGNKLTDEEAESFESRGNELIEKYFEEIKKWISEKF